MQIDVMVADESHSKYADEICEEVLISARERGTGIARRTPEYVIDKMKAGKARFLFLLPARTAAMVRATACEPTIS